MQKETIAIDTPYPQADAYGALSMPVYHCCAYEFESASHMADAFTGKVIEPDYSRTMNPTVTHFEDRVKALTGATNVVAFNSGMAAISNTLIATLKAGSNIVTSRHLFGNTFSLITTTLHRYGVEARLADLTDAQSVEAMVDDNTAAFFLEIITNPQMEVADLKSLASIAHSHGMPLIVDTTMIPFTEFSAKELGVDIELVSSTKYISGGATSLGGLAICYGTFPELEKRLKWELLFNLGAYMTPHAAYMQTLGLETLSVRYARQAHNTLVIAQALSAMPAIRRVNYPALPSSKYFALCQAQYGKTGGAMITIDLESQDACFRFLERLRLVHRATNLFDNRTLAIHPYSTIFGGFSAEEKAAMDVLDTTIRLSIGLEAPQDILDDIKQALA
ncbi:MAG: trans-sulfuration enzyme family protein [Muribaculaceae bacterium]